MNLTYIFNHILYLSFMGSVVIGIILFTKFIFKDKLNARWHYYIWLILIIRLIIPYTPESSLSIYNILPQQQQQSEPVKNNIVNTKVENESPLITNSDEIYEYQMALNNINMNRSIHEEFSYYEKLGFIWIIGMIIMLLTILYSNVRFQKKLSLQQMCEDHDTLLLLEWCKKTLNIKTNVAIIYDDTIKTPSIVGMLRPKLLIPKKMVNQLSKYEMKYVLLHELTHLKRKDIFINWITIIVQANYWFNPLVWYAFYKMRADCEVACDAYVLSHLKKSEHVEYGKTIINVLAAISRPNFIPVAVGMSNHKSNLKRRIWRIKMFKRTSWKWSIMAVVLAVGIGVVGLTNALGESDLDSDQDDPIDMQNTAGSDDIELDILTIEGKKVIRTEGSRSESGYIDYIFIKFTKDIDPSSLLKEFFTVEGYQIEDIHFRQEINEEREKQLLAGDGAYSRSEIREEDYEDVRTDVIIWITNDSEIPNGNETPKVTIAKQALKDMDGNPFVGIQDMIPYDNIGPFATYINNASFTEGGSTESHIEGRLMFDVRREFDVDHYEVTVYDEEYNMVEKSTAKVYANGSENYSIDIEFPNRTSPFNIYITPFDESGNRGTGTGLNINLNQTE
ncbi:M56 family metallopeptidase [Chengkuizengella axinellae]|uniref:M56 family metallopeptidase n=1 Tax=Chengkuizengella axinellae TaxID=3064388 RepID=A0ABT9J481_9BACL|nr:M56 family metallopeptidase [Chengkuizengella sp. 2205SS18-9]MDP5276409.1 M56 family metallopeptidase [Chengkuizengella sp. 2205SS18-9]